MDKKYPTILFVSSYSAAFVLRDIALLQKHYKVLVANFVGIKKTIRDTLYTIVTLWKNFRKADLAFIWFADFRALATIILGKIFAKRTILVIGGYEVACEADISYGGAFAKSTKRKISWIIQHADVIISVSKTSQKELQDNYGIHSSLLVYNGVATEKFTINPNITKQKIAITVGRITKSNLIRKGIESFVRAAELIPQTPCYVIGKYDEDAYKYLRSLAHDNVIFTGFVSDDELIKFYQKAKVYVQVSGHEAFGISLAEAMLCGCIPITTDKGALPEVVGNNGLVVPFNDPHSIAKAISEAMSIEGEYGCREHILENFSMKNREIALLDIINGVI